MKKSEWFEYDELPGGRWSISGIKKKKIRELKADILGEDFIVDLSPYFLDEGKDEPCGESRIECFKTLYINGDSENIIAFTNNRDAAVFWQLLGGESFQLDKPVSFIVGNVGGNETTENYKYVIKDKDGAFDEIYEKYIEPIFSPLAREYPYKNKYVSELGPLLKRKNILWRFFSFVSIFSKYMALKIKHFFFILPKTNYTLRGRTEESMHIYAQQFSTGRNRFYYTMNEFFDGEYKDHYVSLGIMNDFFAHCIEEFYRNDIDLINIIPFKEDFPVYFTFKGIADSEINYLKATSSIDFHNEIQDIFPFMENAELFIPDRETRIPGNLLKLFLGLFDYFIDAYTEMGIENELFENLISDLNTKIMNEVEGKRDTYVPTEYSDPIEYGGRDYSD